ncbi:MAG TPA: ThiF family adenylyltransferase [Candidatus Paceibacterota bacterium]|nr:ThiF family adenylyltransferase [Candidatus Paceibacterota bacterium]
MAQETIDRESFRPVAQRASGFAALKEKHPELIVVDQYRKNLEELFLLRNPKYRFDKNYAADFGAFAKEHFGAKTEDEAGSWFYFPWRNALVHFLAEELHEELRTGRNRYLITVEEQKAFYGATIGILGMSVGSHAAMTIAMTGGAKQIKLADPDSLSGDNLNRIRTGFHNVGVNKAVATARDISEINPYAAVEISSEGIREENAEKFLEGVDVLLEVMDNPYWKLKVRELARARGIPVIMGTDNGDGNIVDIERYDLDKNYPILHGYAGGLTAEGLKNMPPQDLPKVAARIAGANLAVPRMLGSVAEVGKSLYSWPQLGTAANLCGTTLAYLSRRIALKDPKIKSGRYQVSLDSVFESGYRWGWLSRKIAFAKFIKKMMRQQKP